MPIICPTITAYDAHEYRRQIEQVQAFAERIHIDLMDGQFAPTTSPGLDKVWWPERLVADIHLMYQRPMTQLDWLVKLGPNLVVIPFEAEIDHQQFADALHAAGIKVGIALLQNTTVDTAAVALSAADHALVFSGDLGKHGGRADLSLLDKVRQLKQRYPDIEISWDGGINDQNAQQLVKAGVEVLNVGGYIQKSADPADSYQHLTGLL
jgi:ribulose-phosphate 3-epimerase